MISSRRVFATILLFGAGIWGTGTVCLGQAPSLPLVDLLASTPEQPNAILYVDVPAVRKLTEGAMMQADLAKSIGEVRIASYLNLGSMEPNWEVGYVSMTKLPSGPALAKSVDGYIDSIGQKTIVWSPRHAYLIPDPVSGICGIVRPSDRKLVSRWLAGTKHGSSPAYLSERARQNTQFVSLFLAIDLEDVFSTLAIQQRLKTFELLKTRDQDIDSLARTLSTIRGLHVLIGRANLGECIIGLDFSASPAALLPYANPLFAEILKRNDAAIPEVSSWIAKLEGNTLSFRGTITAETIDDLLGIFTLQRQLDGASRSDDNDKLPVSNSESQKATASVEFFRKTSDIIKRVREYTVHGTGERASWNGKMARRLDELPTLNVDPELVGFTAKVSEALRGNMLAIQKTNIANSATVAVNSGYSGYGYDANQPYQYDAVAKAKGNTAFREMMAMIEQMEADMRRKMTEKYQVQF